MNKASRLGLAGAALVFAMADARAADDIMVVFDGSNSMWGQIEGVSKIEIARNAMSELVGDWADNANLGLMAYGHRRAGDCTDIETIVAPGPFDRDAFMARVNEITPHGRTPLASAVEHAAEALAYRDNPATVVVMTDGIETCERDLCELAGELARTGVGFTAHVIGFDLAGEAEHEAVACLAKQTGGRFLLANDAAELGAALSEVGTVVAEAPEPPAETEPDSEPSAESQLGVSAPDTVVAGSSFEVSWDNSIHRKDFVTIVPLGAEEGAYDSYVNVRRGSPNSLRAPANPGLYEVRYVLDRGKRTLASVPVEVVEPRVGVSAPDTVVAGSSFEVSWDNSIHRKDFVTIVPLGAGEGAYDSYVNVRRGSPNSLRAPANPGLYEVRYVLDRGKRTLASVPVEVVEPRVDVSAPETVVIGSSFEVSWDNSIHRKDFVTIVPLGAGEGAYDSYVNVRRGSPNTLRAPAEAGFYEVRYVLDKGKRTLDSIPVEVIEPQVNVSVPETSTGAATLDVPQTAAPGKSIEVSWTAEGESADRRVALAAPDQPDFTWIAVQPAGDGQPLTFVMPDTPGPYEFRFLDITGRQVLDRAAVEVR